MTALLATLVAVVAAAAAPDADRIRARVEYLAADERLGRGLGSAELTACGREIRTWLEEAGAEPGWGDDWYHPFEGPAGEELFNVVGRVAGRGDEVVVVGAHYDGLGVGLPGTPWFGQILNGADDNAAGVAALAEIARRVAAAGELERTVLLVAFSGEEAGLLGSRVWASEGPGERTVAMLNLDTVGRIENERLIVFGTGTADEFEEILRGVNFGFGFDLALRPAGDGASDHTPFFERGIPVLHFFSGAKPEYHRPGDDAPLVDAAATARLADFVAETAIYLAGEAIPLGFRPVGAERLETRPGTKRRRVSFGSIPDFSHEGAGILLSGVMPGGAAEAAGLAAGDLLLAIDGVELDGIHDFQGVLVDREPGDVVEVRFRRGAETREVPVTLRPRS